MRYTILLLVPLLAGASSEEVPPPSTIRLYDLSTHDVTEITQGSAPTRRPQR